MNSDNMRRIMNESNKINKSNKINDTLNDFISELINSNKIKLNTVSLKQFDRKEKSVNTMRTKLKKLMVSKKFILAF